MRTSDWPSPEDIEVGETIEVWTPGRAGDMWKLIVDEIRVIGGTTYISGDAGPRWGMGFTFTYGSAVFAWRRPGASPTRRSFQAAVPVRYGATCGKCNEHYEHAEWRSEFVCYGCKVQM